MRKLLVFQHVPFEPLGTLDGQFRASGFRIRYVNFSRLTDTCPDVRRYHGLVVLGGPMSANEFDRYPHLSVEIDAIRQAKRSLENTRGKTLELLALGPYTRTMVAETVDGEQWIITGSTPTWPWIGVSMCGLPYQSVWSR